MKQNISTRGKAGLLAFPLRRWPEPLPPSQVYPAGVELLTQGSLPEDVYLIRSGLVKMIRMESDGREVIVGLRFPGWALGSASAILGRPRAATAMTLTQCRLHRLPVPQFLHLLRTSSRFSWRVHHLHSREIYSQLSRYSDVTCLKARQRLEHLLWQLAALEKGPDSSGRVPLRIPLRYWEVAQLIAVTPAYLSKLFAQLEEDRLLERSRAWLIVCDPARLWHPEL